MMTPARRSKLVARLISGIIPIRSGDGVFHLKDPTSAARLLSEEAYSEALKSQDLLSEEHAIELATYDGLWNEENETQLNKATTDLDELKVLLYENFSNSEARQVARNRLARCRQIIQGLSENKWAYRDRTVESYAAAHKARILVGLCLYRNDKRVFSDDYHDWSDAGIIDLVVEAVALERPTESEIRELARTNPWQGYWIVGKPNPFGVPAVELSDDRLALCNYSIMYDRIDESPERPGREVIEDDDALDGWLIVQKRKSRGQDSLSMKEKMISSKKIAEAGEVFVMAKTPEEIELIQSWNDFEARRIQKARAAQIAREGVVPHGRLKDVKHELGNRLKDMELARSRS